MTSEFPCPVALHAASRPSRPAIALDLEIISYGRLDELIRTTSQRLSLGDFRSTHVGLLIEPDVAGITLLLALLRAGAFPILLPTRWPEAVAIGRAAALGCATVLSSDRSEKTAAPHADTRPVDQPALAVFTSGSSGEPKAAVLSWQSLVASAQGVADRLDFHPEDRWLLNLPLYHVSGLGVLVRTLLVGASIAIPSPGSKPVQIWDALGVTHASLVPTQLRRALGDGQPPPASLRAGLLGGSAMPPALLRAALKAGWPLSPSYGLTEMASTVSISPSPLAITSPTDAGLVLAGREVEIRDRHIHVRGSCRFDGYMGAVGLEKPFDADGWFDTKDLGHFDSNGFLHVIGRADRMFVSGGENIQPEEIERALLTLPGIKRAKVEPIADPEFGFRPAAYLEVDGPLPPAGEVRNRLRDHLSGLMIPVVVYPLDPAAGDKIAGHQG
ncbi:o-succinylbenzoate--CoA ligase [soil metagenome]